MQLHRSAHNKIMGGVCGGLAESLSIEAIYLRLAFIIFLVYAGNGLLVYLILWLVLPKIETGEGEQRQNSLFRSRTNNMIGGVCGGLSEAMKVDVSIIRLVFIGLSLLAGGGVLIYGILWLIIPSEPRD
ncbi:MAG: PspC domain-containing protein [Candidatus Cloacimonetes bacterium]|nr:PspC domain-containing protein [Candidatus Cloacimonadota bacterium]